MGGHEDPGVTQQGVVGVGGLLPPDVQAHACQPALRERRLQGRAVDRAITVYGICIAAFGLVLAVTAPRGDGGLTEGLGQADLVALGAAALAGRAR